MAIGIDMDPTHQIMFYNGYWYRHGSHSYKDCSIMAIGIDMDPTHTKIVL